tara:strand:+ start:3894 stop:4964 length:1071 start_codon:yes stop_codon:yes gene_type:complete
MLDWQQARLGPSDTMLQALQNLEHTALQIVIVTDTDGKLLGVVTDGDVRRAILSGKSPNVPVTEIMTTDPRSGSPEDGREMLVSRMRSLGLGQMPIVAKDGRVVGLITAEPKRTQPNWTVLMAGGAGERLRPLTQDTPKPMLKVGEKPILETIISQIHEFGFNTFFIAINYLGDQIEAHFGNGGSWGLNIDYLREDQPLGTAGALSLLPQRPDAPMIVMNGDLLTKLNFDKLLDFHNEHASPLTVCVREYTYTVPYGVVEATGPFMDRLMEKPSQRRLVNAGVYVLSPEVLDLIEPNTPVDMTDIAQYLIDRGVRPTVFPIHEYWIDIGQKPDLERAVTEYADVFTKQGHVRDAGN